MLLDVGEVENPGDMSGSGQTAVPRSVQIQAEKAFHNPSSESAQSESQSQSHNHTIITTITQSQSVQIQAEKAFHNPSSAPAQSLYINQRIRDANVTATKLSLQEVSNGGPAQMKMKNVFNWRFKK